MLKVFVYILLSQPTGRYYTGVSNDLRRRLAQHNAGHCIECGKCAEACRQNIPVAEWLKKAHAELTS